MITQLPQGLYFSRVKQSVHRGICFFFLLSFFPIQFTCFFKGYFRCAQSKTHTQRRSSYIQIDSRSKYRGDTQNKQSVILKTVGGLGKGLQTYRYYNVMSRALLEGKIGTKTQVKEIIFMKVMYILCTLGIYLSFILVSSRAHFGIRPSKISENFQTGFASINIKTNFLLYFSPFFSFVPVHPPPHR